MARFADLRMVNLSVASSSSSSSSSSLVSYYNNAHTDSLHDGADAEMVDDGSMFSSRDVEDEDEDVWTKRVKLDRLPMEVYWQICSQFQTTGALSNLSLTSKSVYSATLPELYRAVNITPTDMSSLARITASLPSYAAHIRRITVSAHDGDRDDSPLSFIIQRGERSPGMSGVEAAGIAASIARLKNVFSFEWNDCPIVLPSEILAAVLQLPKLMNFQTCSLPSQMPDISSPRGSWLRSLRVLRLRSLDEARVLNGIVRHCKDTLGYLSIRVAEREELSATVVDDVDTRQFAWGANFHFGVQPNIPLQHDEDLISTNLKSKFLNVVFNDVIEQDGEKLYLDTLALFNFPRVDLTFLAKRVNFSKLRALRIDTMDPLALNTLSDCTVLPAHMKTLDLTFGKAVFPIAPLPSTVLPVHPVEEEQEPQPDVRPPLMSTLLREMRQVENLNLKLFCEPTRQDLVLSAHIAPWLLTLHAAASVSADHDGDKRQYTLKKLSIHIWSISSGHHVLLAPWTLANIHALATSIAGSGIKSLAIDLSRGASPFPELVTTLKEFKSLRKLYINYAPSVYYGSGVYDVCRRQAATLKEQVTGLQLIWLNSVELRIPYRRRDNVDGVFSSTSSARNMPYSSSSASASATSLDSRTRCRSAGALNFEYENEYDYEDEDHDEHCGDEYFADDGNFNIFANRMI
ncbi:uncharacterized protein V1513DRAFT_424015 [Lipomyces chichibuensis]|uniref:uncharacterized protein n=1 Tax=Lipomyces chichibuensis TaxID=1546026 RepID=UPI0033432D3A